MEKSDKIELTRVAFLGATMVVFLMGVLLVIGTPLDSDLALIALLAMVVLNANFFYHTGQAKEDADERLASIANRAMAASWYLTLTAVLVLIVLEGFIEFGLTGEQILGFGLMVMMISMVVYNEVMVRREGAAV